MPYGFRPVPGKHQDARQSPSICCSQEAIWFQLAGGRDANSNLLIAGNFAVHPNVCSNLNEN